MNALLNSFLQKPWKAYCISLPRCTERRERFSAWALEQDLTFTFWDATDKRDLTKEQLDQKKVLVANEYNPGATACRISHERLWAHCSQEKDISYFFILEDDAGFKSKTLEDLKVFLEGVQKFSKPWSTLQLGFGTMTGSELHRITKRVPPNIFQTDFCDQTHAIVYTRQAVQDMLNLSQDPKYKTRPSDGLLLTYVQKKKGIVLCPKQSIIEQTDSISYISTT